MSAKTLAGWVAERTPEAPVELRAHMARDLDVECRAEARRADAPGHEAVGTSADAGVTPEAVAEALLAACDAALERVLASNDSTRETALDLLSADAYVTYAFEAVADDPQLVLALADQAMRRISDHAAAHLARNP